MSVDNSVETSMCKFCNNHVYQMERMLAEKSLYHKKCFRCHQCKIQLQINSYASHEGQVYCKAHHRQIIQPAVKVDNENDVDIVAKSSKYFTQTNFDLTLLLTCMKIVRLQSWLAVHLSSISSVHVFLLQLFLSTFVSFWSLNDKSTMICDCCSDKLGLLVVAQPAKNILQK